MKIAVMASGVDVNSLIPEKFSDAQWLIIVDAEQNSIVEAIEKRPGDGENIMLAEKIVASDCELVICGEIDILPFAVLADNQVTRALGSGLSVADALQLEQRLPLITDHIGGSGCPSSQEHGDTACSCGNHDDQ